MQREFPELRVQSRRKSWIRHPKQLPPQENRQRWWVYDSQHGLHCNNPVHKNSPNWFSARILLLYFSPGNKGPLKHPQSTPSSSRGRMAPFKRQFSSLCPCVPTVNTVCPLCDKRPLHKRASPLREWSAQLVHCARPDAPPLRAKLTPTTRFWRW